MNNKINVDPSTLPDVICSVCGGKYWNQVFIMKKVSALISPTGQEGMINIPTLLCVGCGNEITNNLED